MTRTTLDRLRRYAIGRTLFKPTSLGRAIGKLGFVQADPIRAPARAQDLTLRHRVLDYRAGDLERRYPRLPIEEDFFVNYGFLPRDHHDLMHPRTPRKAWSALRTRRAQAVLEFIQAHGPAHPRVVDAHFDHGKVKNWFGGSSNATTHLLDDMHYRGLLRIARRDNGTRVYAIRRRDGGDAGADPDAAGARKPAGPRPPAGPQPSADPAARLDALIDVVMHKYAPLPAASLGSLLSLLGRGVPQWIPLRAAALARAKQRYAHARVDGTDWYWPADESPASVRWRRDDAVRLLTPFDPIVWDRRRFTLFWDWNYRFEAYTPAPKRKLGYYALPLLWREHVIGWGNLAVADGHLRAGFGYVAGSPPSDPAFARALDEELARMQTFLSPITPLPTTPLPTIPLPAIPERTS